MNTEENQEQNFGDAQHFRVGGETDQEGNLNGEQEGKTGENRAWEWRSGKFRKGVVTDHTAR